MQLELWNGARGRHEQDVLREFVNTLSELAIDEDVWAHAHELARRAGTRGVTVPASDLLIMACAEHHGAALETADRDFALLERS